jgi:hypothetical protein
MTFRSMVDAPRDGTPVEIECSYGRMPWYDLMAWRDGRWWSVNRPGHTLSDEKSMKWRPYEGDTSQYVDPTGGLQFRGEYWGGLPGDMRGAGPMLAPGESMTITKTIPIPSSYFETDPAKLEKKIAKELGADARLSPEPPPPPPDEGGVAFKDGWPKSETNSDWIPPAAFILAAIILAIIGIVLL